MINWKKCQQISRSSGRIWKKTTCKDHPQLIISHILLNRKHAASAELCPRWYHQKDIIQQQWIWRLCTGHAHIQEGLFTYHRKNILCRKTQGNDKGWVCDQCVPQAHQLESNLKKKQWSFGISNSKSVKQIPVASFPWCVCNVSRAPMFLFVFPFSGTRCDKSGWTISMNFCRFMSEKEQKCDEMRWILLNIYHIGSMYGIYTCIWLIFMVNVGQRYRVWQWILWILLFVVEDHIVLFRLKGTIESNKHQPPFIFLEQKGRHWSPNIAGYLKMEVLANISCM